MTKPEMKSWALVEKAERRCKVCRRKYTSRNEELCHRCWVVHVGCKSVIEINFYHRYELHPE